MCYLISKMAKRAEIKKLLTQFGSFKSADIDKINSELSANQQTVLFEELLLLNYIKAEKITFPELFFPDIKPFNLALKSCELFSAKAASLVAVPLDNSDNNAPPAFIHLWLFQGLADKISDNRALLDGNEIISAELKVFISCSKPELLKDKINGKSWQLGYKLAEKALIENDQAFKQALATNWIITGTCNHEEIGKIKLGNKLDLDLKKRKWLMPLDNRDDIAPKYEKKLTIRVAATLTDAVSHITGTATKKGTIRYWPKQINELHILVGGSIKAPFMPLLLTSTQKVTLWTSESDTQSKNKAQLLKNIINKQFPNIKVNLGKELSSWDIQKTEQNLLAAFKAKERLKIIFNITSGTRLMAMGAQTVARLYPNVELVYRDYVNKENGEFTHLLYSEFPPYSGKIKPRDADKERFVHYNWEFLNENDHKAPYRNAEDFLEKLNNKI